MLLVVPIIIDITPLLKNVGLIMKIDETETVSYSEDGLAITKPVHFLGELVNTGRIIVLRGEVDTEISLLCGRCGKEFSFPVKNTLEEEYSHSREAEFGEGEGSGPKKGEYELKAKDFAFDVEANNTINISEAIRQNLITEMPIKPLCDEKCPEVYPGRVKGENNASTKEAAQ